MKSFEMNILTEKSEEAKWNKRKIKFSLKWNHENKKEILELQQNKKWNCNLKLILAENISWISWIICKFTEVSKFSFTTA